MSRGGSRQGAGRKAGPYGTKDSSITVRVSKDVRDKADRLKESGKSLSDIISESIGTVYNNTIALTEK